MDNKETYLKSLSEIKDELVLMGSMVEKALGRSIEALKKRDLKLGHHIIADRKSVV
jgi:phosphate uptake regulator